MRFATLALLTGALAAGGACATTTGSQAAPPGSTLDAEEIRAAPAHIETAYDAILHLRPQFLRTRANPTVTGRSVDPIRVYVNGQLWGTPESLQRLRAEEVVRVRFFRPADAQIRFGLNHGSGALEVTTVGR
jgi:hypothetical protein